TYTSRDTGISFTYPTSWGVKENVMSAIVVFIKDDGSNVNLVLQNMSSLSSGKNMTLKEFVDTGIAEIILAFKNVSVNETEHTVFKGYDAYNVAYSGDFNGNILRWEQVLFRRGDTVYTLTFTSFPEKTDADRAEARKIMDSINIK
ncbi:MAG TPA: PsbP-related protein, partial [Methanocella sp.]